MFPLINSVISGTDYVIADCDYIIAATDFIITATDYRINRHSDVFLYYVDKYTKTTYKTKY